MKIGGRLSSLCAVALVAFLPACQTSRFATPDEIVPGSCKGWNKVTDFMASAKYSRYIWEDALKEFARGPNEGAAMLRSMFLNGWTSGEDLAMADIQCLAVQNGEYLVHMNTWMDKIGKVGFSFLVSDDGVRVLSLVIYSITVIET